MWKKKEMSLQRIAKKMPIDLKSQYPVLRSSVSHLQILVKNTSRKVAEIAGVKGTRDLFRRLLYLSITHDIDLAKVLQYPFLPEPACFAHPDGTMRQSDKAKVFHELKD